jgi:hypothetical protein
VLDVVAAERRELRFQAVLLREQRLDPVGVDARGRALMHRLDRREHPLAPDQAELHRVADRELRVELRRLLEPAELEIAPRDALAGVGPLDAGQDLDQRRLARTVAAEQADALALVDDEVDAAEHGLGVVRLGDVLQGEERHRAPFRTRSAARRTGRSG